MSDAPLVTIGVPVYNSERYLRQSLDSLLAQSYSKFSLIISDNASSDSTPEICREYAAKDARVSWVRNAVNIGNPGNFNRVFELTKTKYLKWSTSDDLWAPTFLERAIEVMEREPDVALCYPKTYIVDAEGQNQQLFDDDLCLMEDDPVDRFVRLLQNIRLAHQHLGVIRADALRKTHLLRRFVASDINLLAELALYGKFYELPERLFFRRFHKTSGSWQRGDREHQAKHYLGATRTGASLTSWRGHLAHFKSVWSAPLPTRSKVRLYSFLSRRMVWGRRELVSELMQFAQLRIRQ